MVLGASLSRERSGWSAALQKGTRDPGAGQQHLGCSERVPWHPEGKRRSGGSRMGGHRIPSWGSYTQQNQMFVRGDGPNIGLLPGIQGQDTSKWLQAASREAQTGQEGAFPY